MQTMTMGFTVQPVHDDNTLAQACMVRAMSYGHHLPSLRDSFAQPDAMDESTSCSSFVATDKASGQAIGTLRIQRGCAAQPLMLEASFELPPELAQCTRAELTRMSVLPGADPLTRLLLWKAGFYFCLANQIQCMVIGARRPALIRQYKSLGFSEITQSPVPFAHAGGLPHSVLLFDVRSAERLWFQNNHALYTFMFDTHHPDMQVMAPTWRPQAKPDRLPAISADLAALGGRPHSSDKTDAFVAVTSAPSQRVSMA
jgi:hypothetical protein